MKSIIFLISVVFVLTACEKQSAKSLPEENISSSADTSSPLDDLNKSMKYFSAIVFENEEPKCKISLNGKAELTPSFAEVYTEDDPIYSKKIISLEETEGMTEEERDKFVILPSKLVGLPDCDTTDEASVAQIVPNMSLTDGQSEEVAGIRSLVYGNLLTCIPALLYGWGIVNWNYYGANWSNVPAIFLGFISSLIGVTATAVAHAYPSKLSPRQQIKLGVKSSIGVMVCTGGIVLIGASAEESRLLEEQ